MTTAEAMNGRWQPGAHGKHWQVSRSGRLVRVGLSGIKERSVKSKSSRMLQEELAGDRSAVPPM